MNKREDGRTGDVAWKNRIGSMEVQGDRDH